MVPESKHAKQDLGRKSINFKLHFCVSHQRQTNIKNFYPSAGLLVFLKMEQVNIRSAITDRYKIDFCVTQRSNIV